MGITLAIHLGFVLALFLALPYSRMIHGAYRFATDPFYSNRFIPTVKELVDRILTGD